jgi:type VI secretion system secreted protein Hcp
MPGNAFINFGKSDVPQGESLQKNFEGDKGWIEIQDWGWEIESESSFTKGQGSSVGKATPGNLTITHYFDTSSPTILKKMVDGKHFAKITISLLKATGKDNPEEYFQINVSEAFVTKVSTKGGEDGNITQDVEFVFKEITVGYKPQKDGGDLDATTPFAWSVKTNNLTAGPGVKLSI